jgi:general stress protein 26
MSDEAVRKEHLSGVEATEKVRSLLKHYRSTMLTTMVGHEVHTRPIGLQGKAEEFDGILWFFADDRSRNVRDIGEGAVTSLIFESVDADTYLHLKGRAVVVRDRQKMEELFTPIIKTWFPEGLGDPHLTLIAFDAVRGDFWDSKAGMLQVLAAFAKAVVTGRRAGGNMGDVTLDRS